MRSFCDNSNGRTSGWPQKVVLGNQRSNQEGWSPAPVLPPVCRVAKHLTVASLLMPRMKTTTTSSLQNKSQGIRLSVVFVEQQCWSILPQSLCAQPVVQPAAFSKGTAQSQLCLVAPVHDLSDQICPEVTNPGTSFSSDKESIIAKVTANTRWSLHVYFSKAASFCLHGAADAMKGTHCVSLSSLKTTVTKPEDSASVEFICSLPSCIKGRINSWGNSDMLLSYSLYIVRRSLSEFLCCLRMRMMTLTAPCLGLSLLLTKTLHLLLT